MPPKKQIQTRELVLNTFFDEMLNANETSIAKAFATTKKKNKAIKTLTLGDKKFLVKRFTELGLRRDAEDVFQITLSNYSSKSRPRYSYSFNKQFPSRKSRNGISDLKRPCNLETFNKTKFLDIPLEIEIGDNSKCVSILSEEAQKYLLNRLRHSKHLDLQKLITPKQYDSNCYFNTMIVILFISDLGREFFYFFRHLMILGELANGDIIPADLRNLFALFNFFIECFFSGRPEAIEKLDTNVLIKAIHDKIGPTETIVDVDVNSNTVRYITDMVKFLSLNSIDIVFLEAATDITISNPPPHIIILLFKQNSKIPKQQVLKIKKNVYHLDSASVLSYRGPKHFCACITCNGEEYIFDGNSHSRLHKMQWKSSLTDLSFSFPPDTHIKWSFKSSEVALIYYRVV